MGIFNFFKKNETKTVSTKNSSLTVSSQEINNRHFVNSNTPFDEKEKERFCERVGITYDKLKSIVSIEGYNPNFVGGFGAFDAQNNSYSIWVYKEFVIVWPFECKEIAHYSILDKRIICTNPSTFFMNNFVHNLEIISESCPDTRGTERAIKIVFKEILPEMWTNEFAKFDDVRKYIKQNKNKINNGDNGFFNSLFSIGEKQMKSIILGDTNKEVFSGTKISDGSSVDLYCLGSSIFAITSDTFSFESLKLIFMTKPYDKRSITQHVFSVKKTKINFNDEAITILINNESYIFKYQKNSFLYNYLNEQTSDRTINRYGCSLESLLAKAQNNPVIGTGYSEVNKEIYEIILLNKNIFIVSKYSLGINNNSDFMSSVANHLSKDSFEQFIYSVDDILEVYSDETINSYHYVKSPNPLSAAIGGSIFGSAYALGELLDSEQAFGTFMTGSLHVSIKNPLTGQTIKLSINKSSKEVYIYFYSIILQ